MEKSNLAKLISNYGGRVWSLVSVFIFIPFYIQILGSENYGLIGFYSLMLGIIGFADAGMSSAIIREFSQNNSDDYKYSILRKLEKIYFIVCFAIILITILSSKYIALYWLKSTTIELSDLQYYVSLIGIGITVQLISSLYFGALFALNNQVKANFFQFIWSVSRSALVILVLLFFSPTIEAYLVWQILCNFLYVILLRYNIIKELKKELQKLTIILEKIPKHVVSYISGMIAIAIISSINLQADKIITSSLFTLDVFGYYNIASTLAQIPVILATPLLSFAFPLFSKFAKSTEINASQKVTILFEKVFFLLNILVFSISFIIIFYAKEILQLWTKGLIPAQIFPDIVYDLRVLMAGSIFLSIQFPLYYLLLSKGKTKYTIWQGIFQISIGVPLLYFFAKYYGLKGVPIPWFMINFGSCIYLMIIVFRNYIKIEFLQFFKNIFLLPIVISISITSLFYLIFINTSISFIPFLFITGGCSVISVLFIYNIINKNKLLSFHHFYNFPNE